jgi:erythromycin esterase-like protein
MKIFFALAAALGLLAGQPLAAQEVNVILPLEAQTCNLPSAPARIPPDADYDTLTKAKGQVQAFQAAMIEYRECLDAARELTGLTDGNQIALNQAHNYSVEMEERIAEQFNVAVRAYKARQAADEG